MSGMSLRAHCSAALLALVISTSSGLAAEWQVDGRIDGKPDRQTGAMRYSKDVSGIACAEPSGFPRHCVVIDDDQQSAQVVTLHDGRIETGAMLRLIDDTFADGKPIYLDGEGVAFADNYFYVLGSHGGPRSDDDEARKAAIIKGTSKIVRLRYDPATHAVTKDAVSTKLDDIIRADPFLSQARKVSLEEGGLTLEGIAVLRGRLYAGFRGPLIERKGKQDRALILSIALDHVFGSAPADVRRYEVKLGNGRGVRDLAVYKDRILVLAGPMNSDNGLYSIYRWKGQSNDIKRLDNLPSYFSDDELKKKDGKAWKPEGLLALDRNASGLRVLLLVDGGDNGMPRTKRIPYP